MCIPVYNGMKDWSRSQTNMTNSLGTQPITNDNDSTFYELRAGHMLGGLINIHDHDKTMQL